MKKKLPFLDRILRAVGLPMRASTTGYPAYGGASLSRLNSDWIGSLLSPDQETRTSLKRLRARCRQLHNNNNHAQRFVSLLKQNVVGPQGIQLEARIASDTDLAELDDVANTELEAKWERWCRVGNCTADGLMGFRDVLNLAMETLAVDGECFIRKIAGFPNNPFRFALQFLDADQVDVSFNRLRAGDASGQPTNEVRQGVEVDEWNRRVAYWVFEGHPSEGHARRTRIPAKDMVHLFLYRRPNQTRGVPFFVTAMTNMNMLGGYEEAEVVAARMGSCKMAVLYSETGEEYTGTRDAVTGATLTDIAPGVIDQLPQNTKLQVVDWQHPNANFDNFVSSMIRSMAVGLNVSYSSLAGDLRQVNFSSIRQGILDERDAWRSLQTFAIDHLCRPVFEAWLLAALMSHQLELPVAAMDAYIDGVVWQPRGWQWVDPLKDVEAAIAQRGAGLASLADLAATQGKDWRDVIDQIAIEDAYAKERGVELNFARPTPASIGKVPETAPGPVSDPVPADGGEKEGQ